MLIIMTGDCRTTISRLVPSGSAAYPSPQGGDDATVLPLHALDSSSRGRSYGSSVFVGASAVHQGDTTSHYYHFTSNPTA